MAKAQYNADSITVLEGLEAVRKRPGMYIGSVGARGLNHLIYEIVDNAVDEHLAGYCSEIRVTLEADSYSEDAPLVGGSCSFTYSCQEQGVINLYLSYSENTTGNTTYSMCETELEIEVNVDNEGEPGGTSDGGDDNTGLYAAVIVIVIVVIVVAIFVIRRDR